MIGAIPSLRCRVDPACAYPAIDLLAGKPACEMHCHAATHPESYAHRSMIMFRRVEPAPVRRHYVAADRAANRAQNRAATGASAASERERFRCFICAVPCGPLGLCRDHVDGWRKHNQHHPLDQITPAQYAARRSDSRQPSAISRQLKPGRLRAEN